MLGLSAEMVGMAAWFASAERVEVAALSAVCGEG